MAIVVTIPSALRSLTSGESQVRVAAGSVRAVIDELEQRYPGIKARLLDDRGVRRFVNLYIGEEDIRFLDGLATELDDGAELSIIPAMAGGAPNRG